MPGTREQETRNPRPSLRKNNPTPTCWLYAVCGDEYVLWVYGTLLVTTLHFWLSAAGYMLLDLTGRPHFLTKLVVENFATRWRCFTIFLKVYSELE